MSLAWPVIASQTTKVEAQKYRPISKISKFILGRETWGKKKEKNVLKLSD